MDTNLENLTKNISEEAGITEEEAGRLLSDALKKSISEDAINDIEQAQQKLNRKDRRRLERELKKMKKNPVKVSVKDVYNDLSEKKKRALLTRILEKVQTANSEFELQEGENNGDPISREN